MLYATGDPESGPSALNVLNLEDGRTWELSGTFHRVDVTGRGGRAFRDGEEFVFVELRDGVYELCASPPEGPSRRLFSFGQDPPGGVGVHGTRIVFAEWLEEGEVRSRLKIARAGESEARELIRLDDWFGPLMWSPDGGWIATTHYVDDGTDTGVFESTIMFLELSPADELVGGPRHVGGPMVSYWDSVWLPDSRGILTTGYDANVWLMPVDPNQSPVALTRDDPGQAWNFLLSPDGHHIAYSSRTVRGSSLWLVDLSEALERAR